MIFTVVLVEICRKFHKIPIFGRNILLQTAKNLEIHLPRCQGPPPPNNPCFMVTRNIFGGGNPSRAGSIYQGAKIGEKGGFLHDIDSALFYKVFSSYP